MESRLGPINFDLAAHYDADPLSAMLRHRAESPGTEIDFGGRNPTPSPLRRRLVDVTNTRGPDFHGHLIPAWPAVVSFFLVRPRMVRRT